jgi:hypothetical protein
VNERSEPGRGTGLRKERKNEYRGREMREQGEEGRGEDGTRGK